MIEYDYNRGQQAAPLLSIFTLDVVASLAKDERRYDISR